MGKTFEGKLDGSDLRVGIVVSRFNNLVTERLLEGALDRLRRSNVPEESTDVCWVPGAFEVPKATDRMARSDRYDGVIALAAVIRGATPHFEYIAGEVTKGLARVNLQVDVPIAFGVITADTIDQALERAGTKLGNKGAQAAETLIEMVDLLKGIG